MDMNAMLMDAVINGPYSKILVNRPSKRVRNAHYIEHISCKVCGATHKTLYKTKGGYVCADCRKKEAAR